MDTAITTAAMTALRSLPSHAWHGGVEYPTPAVIAPQSNGDVPPYYSVVLAHPAEKGTTTIRLPMHRGCRLKDEHRGLTIEVLLGIASDALSCHQGGEFPCAENAAALHHIRNALTALAMRRERVEEARR